jgi:hypothetical protein
MDGDRVEVVQDAQRFDLRAVLNEGSGVRTEKPRVTVIRKFVSLE